MAHRFAESFFAAVETDLDNERASTLGRTAAKLEAARHRCLDLLARLEASDAAGARAELLAAYRQAWVLADHRRWALCLQREAIGLYDHRWVDQVYPPLPPR